MMQVKMLRNARGSEDGFTVKHYESGQDYEVATALGSSFVRNRDAERTGGDEVEALAAPEPVEAAQTKADKKQAEKEAEKADDKPAVAVDEKAVAGAPQNKAIAGAPVNKAAV